jgi:hypothetical protein
VRVVDRVHEVRGRTHALRTLDTNGAEPPFFV